MFDQLVKRSNAVWIYTTGRFAEERRAFLCDLGDHGHGFYKLRYVNRVLLAIAERVNVRQGVSITEVQIDLTGSRRLGRQVLRTRLQNRNA